MKRPQLKWCALACALMALGGCEDDTFVGDAGFDTSTDVQPGEDAAVEDGGADVADDVDPGTDADSGVDADTGADADTGTDTDPDTSDPCEGLPACEEPGLSCNGDTLTRCEERSNFCLVEVEVPCADGEICVEAGDSAECTAGDWPAEGVIILSLDGAGQAQTTANFADGAPLGDVSFLSDPDVACYDTPATTDEFFGGQHLAFALDEPVPAWSDVTITVTPAANAEAVPYVLAQRPTQFDVPPAVDDVPFCHLPQRFGGPGSEGTLTFRVYEDTNLLWGVSNRGNFRGDADTDFDVQVTVTPVAAEDECYAETPSEPLQWPPYVEVVELDEEGMFVGAGNLSEGAPVCGDLDFLDAAFCVPETQLDRFAGNHVYYAIEGGMPEASILSITVTPDPGVDVSLYGAQQGAGTSFRVPPVFPVSLCESSLRYSGQNPGEPETITFNATTNGYNIFFAVAGTTEQGAEGGYTLSIDLLTSPGDACEDEDYDSVIGLEEWPEDVTLLDASSGFATVEVDTSAGDPFCTLDWADSSQNACFPGTEFFNFRGNRHFFALDPPPPGGSSVFIRAIPERDVDVSLMAYTTGTTRYVVPPYVPSVGVCEASYARGVGDQVNPGVIEEVQFLNPPTGNQYNYFIAVGGPEDPELAGNVTLEVEVIEPPDPHCPESLPGASYPTWPSNVTLVGLDEEGVGSVSGDLSEGACTNLSFAERSSVACFPGPQFDRFEGNHVLYALDEPMPPNSELFITLTPDAGTEVNLWGTQTGPTSFPVPPAIGGVIACEASYQFGSPNPGESETIRFSNPTDNSYNIAFAAAGDALTGTSGGYTIDVELVTGTIHCEESLPGESGLSDWPTSVTTIAVDTETGEGTASGNINTGSCTNLDFAQNSAVACFPGTQFDNFEGNHVYFALDEPMPPNSIVTVTMVPEEGADLNLYGYQDGTTDFQVPPAVGGVVACEAGYTTRTSNAGEAESIRFFNPTGNSYNIFAAVAGPAGVTEGAFDIYFDVEAGEPHCPESLPGVRYDAWPSFVEFVDIDERGGGLFEGNISDGECVNLVWAENSTTACFPGTLFDAFEGNHTFHTLSRPLGPGERARITISSPGDALSLYGYQIGTTSFHVPPYVPSTVSCEYGLAGDADVIEFTNPTDNSYNIFFAAAGGDGVVEGEYTIEVEITE